VCQFLVLKLKGVSWGCASPGGRSHNMAALGRHTLTVLLLAILLYCAFLLGNPFSFMVNDPNRVIARGDGLSMLQCGQQASFTITAPGAQLRDIDVKITGTILLLLSWNISLHLRRVATILCEWMLKISVHCRSTKDGHHEQHNDVVHLSYEYYWHRRFKICIEFTN